MRQVAGGNEASSAFFKRRAVSGEEIVRQNSTGAASHTSGSGRSFLSAGGLCEVAAGSSGVGERRLFVPQHLSLPGSDAARRLTILSPHSPQPEAFQLTSTMCTMKTNRTRRAIVLPKLILPRSESDVFSV